MVVSGLWGPPPCTVTHIQQVVTNCTTLKIVKLISQQEGNEIRLTAR